MSDPDSLPVWTAISTPGRPAAGLVDAWGGVTPIPGGPSLVCWVQPKGGAPLTATAMPPSAIRQRMQGRLPVVATGWESGTLRLAMEAFACQFGEGETATDWVAVQAVVFNVSDDAADGTFAFAVVPHHPGGPAPLAHLAYEDQALLTDGHLFAVCQPPPDAWDCAPDSTLPDLAALLSRTEAASPAGTCQGYVSYTYHIAPWEEVEYLAFLPMERGSGVGGRGSDDELRIADRGLRNEDGKENENSPWNVVGDWVLPDPTENPALQTRNTQHATRNTQHPIPYRRIKGQTTAAWTARLRAGMQIRLPDDRLEESWVANVGHLLSLDTGAGFAAAPGLVVGSTPDIEAVEEEMHQAAYRFGYGETAFYPNYLDDEKYCVVFASQRVMQMRGALWGLNSIDKSATEDRLSPILRSASPTFTWSAVAPPDPTSAAYGLTIALWLMLIRDSLLYEEHGFLMLLDGLPVTWLERDGTLEMTNAPTAYGVVNMRVSWQAKPAILNLHLDISDPPPDGYTVWIPRRAASLSIDGKEVTDHPVLNKPHGVVLPPETREVVVHFSQ